MHDYALNWVNWIDDSTSSLAATLFFSGHRGADLLTHQLIGRTSNLPIQRDLIIDSWTIMDLTKEINTPEPPNKKVKLADQGTTSIHCAVGLLTLTKFLRYNSKQYQNDNFSINFNSDWPLTRRTTPAHSPPRLSRSCHLIYRKQSPQRSRRHVVRRRLGTRQTPRKAELRHWRGYE